MLRRGHIETANRTYTLYVGERNSVTNTYYVSMPSETTVYTTVPGNITRFDAALEELLEELRFCNFRFRTILQAVEQPQQNYYGGNGKNQFRGKLRISKSIQRKQII